MNTYYKSKLGEVLTKEDWLEWGAKFYRYVEIEAPSNVWERLVKVLKLKKVSLILEESEASYVEEISYDEEVSNLYRG